MLNKIVFYFLLLGCLLLMLCDPTYAFTRPDQLPLEKIRIQEPKFAELVNASIQQENLHWSQLDEMARKLKMAPWLPVLTLGYDRQFRKDQSVSFNDNISVTSSAITVGPPDNNEDFSLYHSDVVRVRASWNLSELVFHPASLRIQDHKRNLSEARLRLVEILFKIYAERHKLLTQYFLETSYHSPKKIMLYNQIQTLAEKIDALTGSVFVNRWWKERKLR